MDVMEIESDVDGENGHYDEMQRLFSDSTVSDNSFHGFAVDTEEVGEDVDDIGYQIPNDIGVVQYDCEHCARKFLTCNGLRIHMGRMHKEVTQEVHGVEFHNVEHVEEPRSNIIWGDMNGVKEIQSKIEVYLTLMTKWQRNFFDVPGNATGKAFVTEAAHLIKLYNSGSTWSPIALHLVILFFPIMLQKPAKKSKNKDHTRYLKKRLSLRKPM